MTPSADVCEGGDVEGDESGDVEGDESGGIRDVGGDATGTIECKSKLRQRSHLLISINGSHAHVFTLVVTAISVRVDT